MREYPSIFIGHDSLLLSLDITQFWLSLSRESLSKIFSFIPFRFAWGINFHRHSIWSSRDICLKIRREFCSQNRFRRSRRSSSCSCCLQLRFGCLSGYTRRKSQQSGQVNGSVSRVRSVETNGSDSLWLDKFLCFYLKTISIKGAVLSLSVSVTCKAKL